MLQVKKVAGSRRFVLYWDDGSGGEWGALWPLSQASCSLLLAAQGPTLQPAHPQQSHPPMSA